MYFMKIFFSEFIEKNGICDLLALTESWLKSSSYRKNGEKLCSYITWYLFDNPESLEPTKYLYKHKEELEIPKTDWYMVFHLRISKEDETKNDPEVLYIVGKMLWEGYQFNDLYVKEHYKGDPDGLEMIEKAARLGCQEANLFIFEYNRIRKEAPKVPKMPELESMKSIFGKTFDNEPNDTGRFSGVNKDKIREWMRYHWVGYNVETISYSNTDYSNNKERIILDFLCLSHRLGYLSERFGFAKTLDLARSIFANRDNDILMKEKTFIIGLLNLNVGHRPFAKDLFTQIRDYKLANYMLSNTRIIDGLDFKSMSFQNQLSFIKDHLFDYE